MMRRFLFLFFIFFFFTASLFANEVAADKESGKNDASTSATPESLKGVFALNVSHGVLSGIGYLDMIATNAVGQILLTNAFTSSFDTAEAYRYLKISHVGLALSTYTFLGTGLVLSYVSFGQKVKAGVPVNVGHFATSLVTSSLYVFNIATMILAGFYFGTNNPNAKYAGVVHGVASYALLASYTITLITLPIGWNNKKVLK